MATGSNFMNNMCLNFHWSFQNSILLYIYIAPCCKSTWCTIIACEALGGQPAGQGIISPQRPMWRRSRMFQIQQQQFGKNVPPSGKSFEGHMTFMEPFAPRLWMSTSPSGIAKCQFWQCIIGAL